MPKAMQLSLFSIMDAPRLSRAELQVIRRQLPTGTVVAASEDIHFSADKTVIRAGTPGVINTSGGLTCSVHFNGYPDWHYVMCFWDMLLVAKNQPEGRKKVQRFLMMAYPDKALDRE